METIKTIDQAQARLNELGAKIPNLLGINKILAELSMIDAFNALNKGETYLEQVVQAIGLVEQQIASGENRS